MLLGLGGLGLAGKRRRRVPWNSQNVLPLVIIYSTGSPNSGLFIYSTTPGVGNLIGSITTASADPYGNKTIPSAIAFYNPAGLAVAMVAGALFFYTGSLAAGWTAKGGINGDASGDTVVNPGTGAAVGVVLNAAQIGIVQCQTDFDISTPGKGLKVAEGTNSRLGTATMVGGTVTIANTSVVASTRVLFQRSVAAGTLGHLSRTISVGTSFTINSSSNLDTSQIAWMLVDPG